MSTEIKPIRAYGGFLGPNPLKVCIVLTLLDLPYEVVPVKFDQIKEPEYVAINPNGRLPAIHDPNTGLTIWESGAIIEYLIERYDTEEPRKLSFPKFSAEAEETRSFLYLQATGQGPYYGQAVWFKNYHDEKIPSAIDRYVNEAKRVTGVLEARLAKQKDVYKDNLEDGPWLVGNKVSYADVSFIPWQKGALTMFAENGFNADDFPLVSDWLKRMYAQKGVQSLLDSADEQMAQMRKSKQ
jgi:glutathione S-transferase